MRLGVELVAGQNSYFLLSEDIHDYLEDYDLLTLSNASIEDVVSQRNSYWLSLEDINLGGKWNTEWDEYISGLSQGGIRLKESLDSLLWMHNKKNG